MRAIRDERDAVVTRVTGAPRSGASLAMQMLGAGGMSLPADRALYRQRRAANRKPRGGFVDRQCHQEAPMLRTHFAPLAIALALGTGFAAGSAAAEEKSCVDQIEELCGSTEVNTPARRACVKEKRSQLSADCQQRLGPPGPAPKAPAAAAAGSPQEMQAFFDTCRPDQAKIAKLCTGAQSYGDALPRCIVAHESEVSKACADIARRSSKGGTEPAPAN